MNIKKLLRNGVQPVLCNAPDGSNIEKTGVLGKNRAQVRRDKKFKSEGEKCVYSKKFKNERTRKRAFQYKFFEDWTKIFQFWCNG